jgi:hypothetical protein
MDHARQARALTKTGIRSEAASPAVLPSRRGVAPAHAGILGLQRSAGNRAVQGLIQAKLAVSTPGDRYEREADRMATNIVNAAPSRAPTMPAAEGVQRKCAACAAGGDLCVDCAGEAKVMRQVDKPVAGERAPVGDGPSLGFLGRGGRPLPPSVREQYEPRFGSDFGHVRVHTDATAAGAARSLNARAFTVGPDIAFAPGEFAPGTSRGRLLLAHELTHVLQQQSAGLGLQRAEGDVPVGETPPPGAQPPVAGELKEGAPTAPFEEVRPKERGAVERIVISCTDMRIRLETATQAFSYRLKECALPIGSYEATVVVTENDFYLDFGEAAGEEAFYFTYWVEEGQQNPAVLLNKQAKVHVDVVERLAAPKQATRETATPECAIRLEDRLLVPSAGKTRNLFEPISVEKEIWNHRIPLAQFGWVNVAANVSGELKGTFAWRYGPGMLSDICLTTLKSDDTGSETIGIGGRARFSLPARATVRVNAKGELVIGAAYLDVIDVAEARGGLSAAGEATLAGSIDGAVEILAKIDRSMTRPAEGERAAGLLVDPSAIRSVDLAAEIGLRGRARVKFLVTLSAGFSLVGIDLWRQTWPLTAFDAGVSWKGGLKYSPNPGPHWDLGVLDVAGEAGAVLAEEEGTLPETGIREDAADVEEEDIIEAILSEERATVATRDGLSEDTALPFDWYKPNELYEPNLSLPNADDPKSVGQFDGPTVVFFQTGGRTDQAEIGVDDWPAVHSTFQYIPYNQRQEPEKERFRRLVDRLGYNRSGFDIDHVWDIALRDIEYDRFDNLWPASNQEQQLAGVRHRNQIRNYEQQPGLANLNGRWFEIVRFRHPA